MNKVDLMANNMFQFGSYEEVGMDNYLPFLGYFW